MSRHTEGHAINYIALGILCLYMGFQFGQGSVSDTAPRELRSVSSTISDTWNRIESEYDISLDRAYTAIDEAMHGHAEWSNAQTYLEAVDDLIDFVEELQYEIENRADDIEAEQS